MSGDERGARGRGHVQGDFAVVGQGLGFGGESDDGAQGTEAEGTQQTEGSASASASAATAGAPTFAAGQSRGASAQARRNTATRERQRRAAEAHRARIYGNSATASRAAARARPAAFAADVDSDDERGATPGSLFTQRNRFAGFDPDHVAASSSVLNSLLAAEPSWLTAGGGGLGPSASPAIHARRRAADLDDVWGSNDESDEHMQRLLEQSYAASRRVSAQDFGAAFRRDGNDENDEAAMLEAAIRASLESHGAPDNAMKEGGAKDGAADPRSDADIQVDEEALARALELSTQLDRDSKTLNQEIIDVQIASLVESHPEEVVMQTISIFDEMRERYEKDGGALPSVDDALAQAERQVKQRKQQEETQAALALQFQEFADSLPPEVLAEARQIFEDLSKEMAESGGRAPTVEYAISLAQDRAKARRAEQQRQEAAEEKRREEAREAEEKQKQEEREQEANERKRETREERAARIAASYARK